MNQQAIERSSTTDLEAASSLPDERSITTDPEAAKPLPDKKDGTITDLEAAKLLVDEWKFRQQHGWNSLQRYGLAAVTVSIAPYLKLDMFSQLGRSILVFPVVGWLLALAAVWLFAAEYVRCYPVEYSFQCLLKDYQRKPDNKGGEWLKRVLEKKVGWTTIYLLGIGFTVLSIANGFILIKLLKTFPQSVLPK